MRFSTHLALQFLAATIIQARPQDEASTPDISLSLDNLPGFCPSEISTDSASLGKNSGEDCRCGSALGLAVADVDGAAQQPLGNVPDWLGGGNCGCLFGKDQCGCYDGVSNGDGWALGSFDSSTGVTDDVGDLDTLGKGGKKGKCTVVVTETQPGPIPTPTNPGECSDNDRYCTITITVPVTVPGQPQTVTIPGVPVTQTVPGRGGTVTVPVTVPGVPVTQTVPGVPITQSRSDTITVPVPVPTGGTRTLTATSGQFSTFTPQPDTTGRPGTTIPVTSGGGGTTSTKSIVTVNAAPRQTGGVVVGVVVGGAAVWANL